MSIADFVCRICKSFMQPHSNLRGWLKCNCGFAKVEKPMISIQDYLMGRDTKYPSEYTPEITSNATKLLEKVNALLMDLKIDKVTVNSGWRPAAINNATVGSAKKSNHMLGLAVDLADLDCSLWNLVIKNMELLERYGLFLEDKRWTKSWVHFQCVPPKSGKRVLIPSSAPPSAPELWDGKYDSKFDT